jgi:WD40 repeat protein
MTIDELSEQKKVGRWTFHTHRHKSVVNCVALSGKCAISGSVDQMLIVWDWQTGERLRTLEGHAASVTSLALSNEFAISGSVDQTLIVWDWQTGEKLRTLEGLSWLLSSPALVLPLSSEEFPAGFEVKWVPIGEH